MASGIRHQINQQRVAPRKRRRFRGRQIQPGHFAPGADAKLLNGFPLGFLAEGRFSETCAIPSRVCTAGSDPTLLARFLPPPQAIHGCLILAAATSPRAALPPPARRDAKTAKTLPPLPPAVRVLFSRSRLGNKLTARNEEKPDLAISKTLRLWTAKRAVGEGAEPPAQFSVRWRSTDRRIAPVPPRFSASAFGGCSRGAFRRSWG